LTICKFCKAHDLIEKLAGFWFAGRGIYAASMPPANCALKRAEARAPKRLKS
jgi:hypothetical protein